MRTGKELFNTLLVELNEMGLPGMSATLDEMYRSPKFLELDPLTAIANLVEPEYQKKMNKRILSRLRSAHLRGCPQELSSCVDSGDREYLPRGITGTLSTLDFIDSGLNVCILGPSDSGKSYLAKAIGVAACNTYKVEYHHCETLLEEMVALKAADYSKYQKRMKKTCGAALLILDDFLLHTITDEREVKVLFEILEKRSEINLSTIICSQREPASWSSMIKNAKRKQEKGYTLSKGLAVSRDLDVDLAQLGLDGFLRVAIAVVGRGVFGIRSPLASLSAQFLVHLHFHDLLDNIPEHFLHGRHDVGGDLVASIYTVILCRYTEFSAVLVRNEERRRFFCPFYRTFCVVVYSYPNLAPAVWISSAPVRLSFSDWQSLFAVPHCR